MKPVKVQAKMAAEIISQNIDNLPHPDFGMLKLVYFGHKSEGQSKITKATAEAIVMLLEANGQVICNGLSEAAAILARNGYVVEAPAKDPQEAPGGPVEDPAVSVAGPETLPLFSTDGVV